MFIILLSLYPGTHLSACNDSFLCFFLFLTLLVSLQMVDFEENSSKRTEIDDLRGQLELVKEGLLSLMMSLLVLLRNTG